MRSAHPLAAGAFAVAAALVVVAVWCGRSHDPVVQTAVEATVLVRVTRHDALGMPVRSSVVREPSRVRAIVEALGVDGHPEVSCPPDYAAAELGLVLSGRDVYAKRNVYVWDLFPTGFSTGDAGASRVVVVSSSGCRGGPAADAATLRRELDAMDAGP